MIRDLIRTMGRRWYAMILGLALTAGLGWTAYQATPPEYHARSLILLLPGKSAVEPGGNPFLALSGLEQPASIVVSYFSSTSAQDEVAAVSKSAKFIVALDSSTRGPVIAVDATDSSVAGAMSTLKFLDGRVPEELARLQKKLNAPQASVISSMSLTTDKKPKKDSSGTIRITIAALAVGVVATGVATFALDGFLMRRRLRRSARVRPTTAPEQDIEPESSKESTDAPQTAETSELAVEPTSTEVVRHRHRRGSRGRADNPTPANDDSIDPPVSARAGLRN